jgi:hypothetical protein
VENRWRRPPFKPSPLTLNATTGGLCVVASYSFWAHVFGHTPGTLGLGGFFARLFRIRKENAPRRRFF